MFDMGPYYLTALTTLLGPVRRVTGSAQISFPERPIYSQPHAGEVIKVNTPTYISGVFDFAAGVVGTIITTFDVWAAELPRIEIYGADGTLSLPDPNTFGGPVRLRRGGEQEWQDIPLTHGYIENSRGLGLADLGLWPAHRSGAPRLGRAGLSRPRSDARIPRCIARGPPYHGREHARAPGRAAEPVARCSRERLVMSFSPRSFELRKRLKTQNSALKTITW